MPTTGKDLVRQPRRWHRRTFLPKPARYSGISTLTSSGTNAFGATFRGHLGCAKGFDQLVEAAESYQIAVREVTAVGGDQVLAVVGAAMRGASSGIDVTESVFSIVTLRDALILRIAEYLNRPGALEAVGMSEQPPKNA